MRLPDSGAVPVSVVPKVLQYEAPSSSVTRAISCGATRSGMTPQLPTPFGGTLFFSSAAISAPTAPGMIEIQPKRLARDDLGDARRDRSRHG